MYAHADTWMSVRVHFVCSVILITVYNTTRPQNRNKLYYYVTLKSFDLIFLCVYDIAAARCTIITITQQ